MSSARWAQLLLAAATLGLVVGCGSDDDESNGNTTSDPCNQVDCGDHGTCNPDTGTCSCSTGYVGDDCASCADGYVPEGDACVAAECTGNDECDDGVTCNGMETCNDGVCEAGTAVSCQQNATCQEPDGTCDCDEGFVPDGSTCIAALEIIGEWIDDWGFSHDVAQETWKMGDSVFHIAQFENETDFLVAQNDAANEWSPELWSRFDWTFDSSDLYYCQIAYDAADEATAVANTSADRTDLAAGCAGSPWSKLDERLEIIGSYVDDYDSTHDVTQTLWTMDSSVFHITQFDNEADFLVAQNDAANEWNAELWSRFDWTFDGSDLYYCQIAYDAADEATAAANTSADQADLTTGCAGFAWTKLTN